MKHCCVDIEHHIMKNVEVHNDSQFRSYMTLFYIPKFDEYGMSSPCNSDDYYEVNFCPFCGSKFPGSKRSRWFEELNRMGYDDPNNQAIPAKYKTRAWYLWKKDK